MYWHEGGHPNAPPDVSSASCPKDAVQQKAVKEFMEAVSWENEPINRLMELVDRPSKDKFHKHTQKLREDGLLRHLDQGPFAVNSSLAAIVNMTVQPHRDANDARDGWSSTNSWEKYEGAWVVYPDLGIMVEQEPGDIMLCRTHFLEHWLTKIISGQRYCCTRLTKQSVINPLDRWVRCPTPGCDWKAGRVASLRPHVQTKHLELTDLEIKSIMDNIQIDFPEYSAKDIKAIAFIFRARMAEQEKKEAKIKAKMEAKQVERQMQHGDLEDGLSGNDDTEAGGAENAARGEDEEDEDE